MAPVRSAAQIFRRKKSEFANCPYRCCLPDGDVKSFNQQEAFFSWMLEMMLTSAAGILSSIKIKHESVCLFSSGTADRLHAERDYPFPSSVA